MSTPDPETHPPTSIPKRKPVPPPPLPPAPAPAPAAPTIDELKPRPQTPKWPPAKWTQRPQKKQRIFLISIAIAILLLALIIGLAVGLTRHSKQNLPLPTTNGGPYTGDLTYYDPALGSCGITSSNSDMVCAVSQVLFDAASTGSNPNANPLCGMKVRLKRGEASVDVTVVDRCTGCAVKDLDVSRGVFKKLADLDLGRVSVDWAWLEEAPVSVR
ncbi:RlpA-like double-psi beta-barrel-protein domain-containing protein-containing protein [Aspergillus pseudotamarii]|uniref:RlpA-like double-psi beta-barrel-protein domain-containing protein-containing protein n=1 Tax=Aspergillus pseudotamarii TaxID=132259 RepID=A0A5N6T9R0_ASPPS|nr:RlpA-like double-psi beta-barrel-protein domain-containing protein-containing protein [Aspergillus pseudotamarii]KAE8143020.1 RlpA-like double-psi beta-barrel-protein domain-containing protein-containing protein [Aspergillus pseudotamarii]